MKNQYFGDINDYRKYGLLRIILEISKAPLLVAWMLTPDDGSTDGKFISYLDQPSRWLHHDPDLYTGIKALMSKDEPRAVSLIETSNLLPDVSYHSLLVPDSAVKRRQWFNTLIEAAKKAEFVFLDPDNGIEIKSRPYGRKNSSKYVYWHEIEALWNQGCSLLIYQHFIREKRSLFIPRMMSALQEQTPNSQVKAFSTPHVLFLLALQPEHQPYAESVKGRVKKQWRGQIWFWET